VQSYLVRRIFFHLGSIILVVKLMAVCITVVIARYLLITAVIVTVVGVAITITNVTK